MQLLILGGVLILVISSWNKYAEAGNILFMVPFPAPSHWMWLEHFQRDLLRRGHFVTTVCNHPTKHPHPNLTEIIINPKFDIPYYFPKKNIFTMRFSDDFQNLKLWWQIGLMTSEHALNDVNVQSLISANHLKFDLLILEQFYHESFLMFAHKYKCPVVTICTMGYANHMERAMGLITPWSLIPHNLLPHTDHMSLWQRSYNVYLSLYDTVMRKFYYLPQMQAMAVRHFTPYLKDVLPYVGDLEKNISLMLVNSHHGLDFSRPTMNGLVNVGGAHLKLAKPLPQHLKAFMDNATEGVIYFSLGSYMKGTDMPSEKSAIILKAFSRLKQKVLWKYENNSVPHLPANIMLNKWLPQNDILAHPNIKLFITHGGIFGTQEGIYWAIPMLCIPLYGDQHRNTIKSVRDGYARSLVFSELTVKNLIDNIQVLIENPAYKQKAVEASKRFRDNLVHPLDEASYWIEYVMRYKGATHLKSYGSFMPLHEYLLLDLLLYLTTAFVILVLALRALLKLAFRFRFYLLKHPCNKRNEQFIKTKNC